MGTRTLGAVPTGCRHRLLAHYGDEARQWLDAVPGLLTQAAERWELLLGNYHDAGHASAIATATRYDGRPLLLKAWADSVRYRHEVDALRLWADGPAVDVVAVGDDLAVAAMELVGASPGGGERPPSEVTVVGEALQRLHVLGRRGGRPAEFPLLADHVRLEVLPRIRRRAQVLDLGGWRDAVEAQLPSLTSLREAVERATVLHADVYRDNVLFDVSQRPRLIDPLPMWGDAAFDWAFWTVYYDLGHGSNARLAAAARISRIPVLVLAPWCRALALDGLLYYVETGDPRAPVMADVLAAFPAPADGSRA